MNQHPTVDAFAHTYNTPSYADPTEAVADFNRYQREWSASEFGSHAISTRMELPRERIREWEKGSKPDVVRGIETAREHAWLECDIDSSEFAALNRLVAGVYSGGSIAEANFVPSFSVPDSMVEDQLRADLELLGAGCRLVMSNSGNVEEFRPERDSSVLGRVLVALGAPQGQKAQTVDALPAYLESASDGIRHSFVRVYVSNRGVHIEDKGLIQIMEQRPARYLDALAELIRSVTDIELWRGDGSIRFRDDALSVLDLV